MTARDFWIEMVEGVQGGRPVIKGTGLTVSAIYGRMSSGDTVQHLVADYPAVGELVDRLSQRLDAIAIEFWRENPYP